MSKDYFPRDALVKKVDDYMADQPQKNGKKKRKISERQLQALAEEKN